MFVLLTPLALAAFAGLVAFVGAIVAGILRMVVPLRDLPQWIFLGTAYVGIAVTVWVLRDYWTGQAYEFMGLIAKAVLIATQ
jgi:ABC-type Fe3+-siderophore transport system permease subunit